MQARLANQLNILALLRRLRLLSGRFRAGARRGARRQPAELSQKFVTRLLLGTVHRHAKSPLCIVGNLRREPREQRIRPDAALSVPGAPRCSYRRRHVPLQALQLLGQARIGQKLRVIEQRPEDLPAD